MAAFVNGSYLGRLTTSAYTASYTVGSGANRLLVVGIWADTSDVLTTVTYAGNAMTLVGKVQVPSDRWIYMYYQVNPTSGSNTLAINASSSIIITAYAADYINFAQTGQPHVYATGTQNSGSSPFNVSATISLTNTWLVWFGKVTTPLTYTGTNRIAYNDSAAMQDSNGFAGTGSQSMGITYSGTASNGAILAAFTSSDQVLNLTESISTTETQNKGLGKSYSDTVTGSDTFRRDNAWSNSVKGSGSSWINQTKS